MLKNYLLHLFIISILSFTSCKNDFDAKNYEAYFGGEIINPQDKYILFLKDDKVLDTIYLNKNNRFLHKFDSLTPGLYTFKNNAEYQYIYFDKNDSLMIRLNSHDFDNSLAFCGRGDEKNNFLIDLFLKNEKDAEKLYDILNKPENIYIQSIDSSYNKINSYYVKKKSELNWSEGFDNVAKASVDYNYYYKKELLPYVHKHKTGKCILTKLPATFYDYRKKINYNNSDLANFSPFVKYVMAMLNNIAYQNCKEKFNEMSLENNVVKLNITDTLFKNTLVKNTILNNIAYTYLLEDQNMHKNKQFIDKYLELSTDKEQQTEVSQIYNAIQKLKPNDNLPNIDLEDTLFNKVKINSYISNKETVIFFWTSHSESHILSVHKKVKTLQSKYPNVNFIGVNVNDTNEIWISELKKYNISGITQLRATNFDEIKKKWVITKINRTLILNPDGTIKNAFANLFNPAFEENLSEK